MPGVLLVECAAQAAGVLWQPSGMAFLAGVSQFRFRKPVLPDQTLEIEVTLEKYGDHITETRIEVSRIGSSIDLLMMDAGRTRVAPKPLPTKQ